MFIPGPSEEVQQAFIEMTSKQEQQTPYAYLICAWNRHHFDIEIQKDKDSFDEPYLKDFIKDMNQSGQPRYGLIDWNDKIMFVCNVPDESKPKNKMMYASCYPTMLQSFQGIDCNGQFYGTGADTLTEDALFCKMRYNDCYEKKIWQIRRIIWIGFYKNVATELTNSTDICLIATLSKDLIKLVLSYATHVSQKFQRYKQYYKYMQYNTCVMHTS